MDYTCHRSPEVTGLRFQQSQRDDCTKEGSIEVRRLTVWRTFAVTRCACQTMLSASQQCCLLFGASVPNSNPHEIERDSDIHQVTALGLYEGVKDF